MSKIKKRNLTISSLILLLLLCATGFAIFRNKDINANAGSLTTLDSIIFTDPSAFQFTPISSTECSIKLIDKNQKNVRVPKSTMIDGVEYNIIEVASNGFSSTQGLKTVVLPYIMKIGSAAFQNCKNLELVYAPKAKEIGSSTFALCLALQDIIFPSTLETIGSSVFMMSTTKVHARFDAVQSGWASNWNAGNKVQTHDFNEQDEIGNLWKHDFIYEEVQQTNPLTKSVSNVTRLAPLQPYMEQASQGHLEIPATDLDLMPFTFVDGKFDSITILSGSTPINLWSMPFANIQVTEGITINREVTYNCGYQESGISELVFNTVDTPFITLPTPTNIFPGMFFSNTIENINFKTSDGIIRDNIGVIKLPRGINEIGHEAFQKNNNIKHLYVPSTITAIGNNAFAEWDNTQTIYVPFFSEAQADSILGAGWRNACLATIEYSDLSVLSQPIEIKDANTYKIIYELKVNKYIFTLDELTTQANYLCWDNDAFIDVLDLALVKTEELRGDYWVRRWEYTLNVKSTSTGGCTFIFNIGILKDNILLVEVQTAKTKVHVIFRTALDFMSFDFDASLYENYNYYLLNDIDLGTLTNSGTSWFGKEKINYGNFYGNFNTISYKVNSGFKIGLFLENSGNIQNLNVNAIINISGEIVEYGGIANINNYGACIENCRVIIDADINCQNSSIGGVVFENDGLISNCLVIGSMISSSALSGANIGGIAVYNAYNSDSAEIANCTNNANITGYGNIGGIVSTNYSHGTIANCTNKAKLTYNYKYYGSGLNGNRSTGGIVAYNQGSCTYSKNTGIIKFGQSDSPEWGTHLEPAMGLIIGTNDSGGSRDGNVVGGLIDFGSLSENFNGQNQRKYVRNAECGKIN